MIRIRQFRRSTKTSCFANLAFVSQPQFCRPHEGFVVKPGWHQFAERTIHRTQIEIQTGPGIDTISLQTFVQLALGSADIWQGTRTAANLDNGVGIFRARAKNAPRAVIFETAANQINTIGQQG